MRVLAINGSARPEGNTAFFIRKCFEPLKEAGHHCEVINLAGKVVRGCTACLSCREEGNDRCIYDDDIINTCIDEMERADAIIIASPVYFSDITAETKALIDRAGYVARGNGNFLSRKIGADITVARRAGTVHALHSINQFFFINDMVVPGSSYWNIALAKEIGDGEKDEEGIRTMRRLGENIAWLLEKLHK
ncbi:MAG TPA: flavodoxin family protein [Sediminispirochaeta sp.]|nr:flavodoxin family protein [Sediminispirochaeta sp.]